MSTPPDKWGSISGVLAPAARTRRPRRGRCEYDEGSSVAGGTGRARARGVRSGMRAAFRPDQAGSEEESRIQSSAGQARGEEEGRGQRSAGRARGEEKDRGRSGGLAEEGGRSEEEGGDWPGGSEEEGGRRAQGRKRLTEEGRRASEDSEEGRHPKAARPEGEVVVVAGVRDEALLVGARGLRGTEHGSTGSPTS